MIDIRELRIGNFTRDKLNKTPYEINARSLLFLAECEEINKEFPIEPIPLTEEILIKAGFEKADKGIEIHLKNGLFNWYSSNPKSIILEFDNGINGYDFEIECEFFHQLQNIIFDLTGEELEITF